MTSTPQEIKSALLLYSVVLLFLITCFIARREYDEKRVLEKQLQLLEDSFRQQQEKNQLQVDSLQQYIELREEVNLKLKDSIRLLQKKEQN